MINKLLQLWRLSSLLSLTTITSATIIITWEFGSNLDKNNNSNNFIWNHFMKKATLIAFPYTLSVTNEGITKQGLVQRPVDIIFESCLRKTWMLLATSCVVRIERHILGCQNDRSRAWFTRPDRRTNHTHCLRAAWLLAICIKTDSVLTDSGRKFFQNKTSQQKF